MTTVAKTFGFQTPRPNTSCEGFRNKTKLGIELELEGVLYTRAIRGWRTTLDNSLRGSGYEFVSSTPRNGIPLRTSLNNLFASDFIINANPSWRCGLHVHIDVREWDLNMLRRFMMVYLLNERKMFDHVNSQERWESNFCAPIQYCDGLLRYLFRADAFLAEISAHWNKYTAMNLIPMGTQGSIEWRGSKATTNKDDVIGLINDIYRMVEVAQTQTAGDILQDIRKVNVKLYQTIMFYSTI